MSEELENASNENEEPVIEEKDIRKEIEDSLTEEEKKEIIKNEKARKKEEKKLNKSEPVEIVGFSSELTEEEKKQSREIQANMSEFLSEKLDISEGSGEIDTLPTGIDVLDAILGGGFGCGTFSLIVGNPGTFKSALLAQIIGAAQKKFRGKLLSSFLDSEVAMTTRRMYQLGVRNPMLKPYSDITVESVFKTIEAYCAFKSLKGIYDIPSIVGWDSLANTITEKEKAGDSLDPSKVMGLKARILSSVLPRYVTKMRDYNISLIVVNQLRDKMTIGPYATQNPLKYLGMDKDMPGGNAIKYNCFHLLHLTQREDLKFEQWGIDGIRLEAKCLKNKLFVPNVKVDLIVEFTQGISNFWTNYNFLVNTKRIKPGSWGSLITYPETKWQGTKKCKEIYDTDDSFKEAFDLTVKETIQVELIDRYNTFEFEEEEKEEESDQ